MSTKRLGSHFCMKPKTKKTTSQYQSQKRPEASRDNLKPTGHSHNRRCRRIVGKTPMGDDTANRSPCRIGHTPGEQLRHIKPIGAPCDEPSFAPVLDLAIRCEEVLNKGTRPNKGTSSCAPVEDPEKKDYGRNPNPQGRPARECATHGI